MKTIKIAIISLCALIIVGAAAYFTTMKVLDIRYERKIKADQAAKHAVEQQDSSALEGENDKASEDGTLEENKGTAVSVGETADAASVQEGIEFLKYLDAKNPDSVDEEIKALRAAELAAEREAKLELMRTGEIDVWSQFEDYMIIGDSRVEGFSFYGFLDPTRVCSERGATMRDVVKYKEQMSVLNPAVIFLCYGVNDILEENWTNSENTTADIAANIAKIREVCPNADIYINSILKVRNNQKLQDLSLYNNAIKEFCQANNCTFIDNDAICDTYAGKWGPDGIHVHSSFYPYWAVNMIEGIMNNIAEESDELSE